MVSVPDAVGRPVSYAIIEYNKEVKSYIYYGSEYGNNGEIRSYWRSTRVTFDDTCDGFEFLANGRMIETGERVYNWGEVEFEEKIMGKRWAKSYVRAKGRFVDDGTDVFRSNFYMDKISRNSIKSLVGKSVLISHEDISEFVMKYRHDRGVGEPPLSVGESDNTHSTKSATTGR
ncbi:MAG: hypothetical protein AAF809_10665 [Bacteroidota bacterium]